MCVFDTHRSSGAAFPSFAIGLLPRRDAPLSRIGTQNGKAFNRKYRDFSRHHGAAPVNDTDRAEAA